ncbi:MAG: B12-binding domain-containing radical SAM protein [Bacteroidetes bacterium]|nr:B12-binding domain-containing radical SAM protein [Bacteroidota bacterium]
MFYSPFAYDEPLFRPPSEAHSLIFQVTLGCSWNRCAFCEMYTSKTFRVRNPEAVSAEIDEAANQMQGTRKVFLADGNAMVLSSHRLLQIIDKLNSAFPSLNRVSAYAMPRDLEHKSEEELRSLREAGLKILYVGIESGDPEVLKLINKGEIPDKMVHNLRKAQRVGIKTSVMIITGLGGKKYSRQHAIQSAEVVNAINPDFLSTLVLSFPFGKEHYEKRFKGSFEPMDKQDLLEEQYLFLKNTKLNNVIYRSDHASNYKPLKGILDRDKERLLSELEQAVSRPDQAGLRQEWQRGL